MCGICAIAGTPGGEASAIGRMVGALRHRGPDAQRVQHLEGCELGHARLSVIDLESGAQPMSDVTKRHWITCNGELYNYRELRAELLERGHRFASRSDTEVVIAAFREWGPACLDRFRGMFAFVIWDAAERTLFAARDLCGEKPLYYATRPDGSIALASELRSLLEAGSVSTQLNLGAVDAYLAMGYVPPDVGIYAGVSPVPPGHHLVWSKGRVTVTRYWMPNLSPIPMTLASAADRVRELIGTAVRRQTVSDVPIGAFLSGGLDSSTIVALMQQASGVPVKTFSVGFGSQINELPYARAVAEMYGTEHHEIDLGAPDVGAMLTRMAEVYDEPFADSSNIPTYLISEFARRHVTVALSGDGGDELFGGYARSLPLANSDALSSSMAEWIVLRLASRMARERIAALWTRSVAAGLRARWPDMWTRSWRSQVNIGDRARRQFWGARAGEVPALFGAAHYAPEAKLEGLDRAFYFDLTVYLPGDILVKVDRASMAHGLETRAPFLDRDLMEFALSIPHDLKVRGGESKVVLREACARYWPSALRTRGKLGFGAPYGHWLRRADVKEHVKRVFANGSALRRLLPGIPAAAARGHDFRTWTLLTLGLWLERHPASA